MNANQKKVVIIGLVVAALTTGCATTRGDPGHYYALMVNDEGKEVECEAIGLNVTPLENDAKLQDLVLTVHHCYMHSFMNTPAFKAIENHLGDALIKNVVRK